MVYIISVVTLLFVVWGWRNPYYLTSLLIFALSLEVSSNWFPHLVLLNKLGAFEGVVNTGWIMIFCVIAYFLTDKISKKNYRLEFGYQRRVFWQSPLFLITGVYILAGLLSLVWSVNQLKTVATAVHLGILWLMGIAVYNLVHKSRERWLVPITFSLTATVVAGIGVYEAISKHYLWLEKIYKPLDRVNSTFADANIMARFLIIGVLATLAWIIMTYNRTGKIVGFTALFIQIVALLATGSRTGWFIVILVMLFFMVLVPRRIVVIPLIGSFIIVGLYSILNPALLGRITDLSKGIWQTGSQGQYLFSAAWDMFVCHPFLGVGLGGFQKTFLTNYSQLGQNVTFSYAAVMTTASELGILGLGLLGGFLYYLYQPILKLRSLAANSYIYSELRITSVLSIFAILAITAIFISAQAESRFFEDPFLWIILGYLTALGDLERVD
jgi:O-antigen ligase